MRRRANRRREVKLSCFNYSNRGIGLNLDDDGGSHLSLRIRAVLAVILLSLTMASAQQQAPSTNPNEVYVKGRLVSHSWRNGRIYVPTHQLQPLLNLGSEMPDMDLLKALEEKGDYLWSLSAGRFEAKPDPSAYSQVTSDQARSQNLKAANANKPRPSASAAGIKLQYEVDEYTTDWGTKWGRVRVTNKTNAASDVCIAYCHFQDSFGRTYAEDWWPVKSLAPGESTTFEIMSGKAIEDTPITPSGENVMVYFLSQEDASKNPTSMREANKQAKTNKKKGGIKNGPSLDFNKNGARPPSTTPRSNPIGPAEGW
jgi:hypothetical protein